MDPVSSDELLEPRNLMDTLDRADLHPPKRARLSREQKGRVEAYTLDSPFTIGRSQESNLQLTNKLISRVHATIRQTEQGESGTPPRTWVLHDSSTNGVFIAGRKKSR